MSRSATELVIRVDDVDAMPGALRAAGLRRDRSRGPGVGLAPRLVPRRRRPADLDLHPDRPGWLRAAGRATPRTRSTASGPAAADRGGSARRSPPSRRPSPRTSPRRRSPGRQRADVAILGGGYTGLWTAIRLRELEPSLRVVVIESDVCGGGASGRNGGFVTGWWDELPGLIELAGDAEAVRTAEALDTSIADMAAFLEANAIDAWWTRARLRVGQRVARPGRRLARGNGRV